jgi:uncharacterized protein (DUF2237 family)
VKPTNLTKATNFDSFFLVCTIFFILIYLLGTHLVCAQVTQEFLVYTKQKGNDLSTPKEKYNFPGLVPGDRWCLCVFRWYQAYKDGLAPPPVLDATNIEALDYLKKLNVTFDDLKKASE